MSFRRLQIAGASRKRAALLPIGLRDAPFQPRRLGLQRRRTHGSAGPQEPSGSHGTGVTPQAALRTPWREEGLAAKKVLCGEGPPPRRAGTNATTDEPPARGGAPQGPRGAGGNAEGGAKTPATRNRFIQKLSEMENSAAPGGSETPRAAQPRGCEEGILRERRRMLVFRDVGMDLDKPVLSRDTFLVLKYFRYGIEFAVDNELERMLRYFNEHALNELKIIQNSKLMRGPAMLSRKKSCLGRGGASFQAPPLFPSLQAANMRQFCAYTRGTFQTVNALMRNNLFGASVCQETDEAVLNSLLKARHFAEQDPAQLTSFSSLTFRRPAVVIYSQLGQKLGAQADLEWRRLAYATICPFLLRYFPKADSKGEGHVLSASEQHQGGLRHHPKDTSVGMREAHAMPVDVISLRSMDVYKYRWVHRLYVRRFAQSLVPPERSSECTANEAQIGGLLTASTTFVGCRLLQPFYSILGLRNYLSPHVMLVDHEGVIRWLTAGCPDDYEREHFPALLKQLEEEYYCARGR